MKKNKLWRLIWIMSLYAALGLILYLVVIYKVKWETRDFNTYLYFYKCNDSVCSTTTKPSNIYSKMVCENDECPYISGILNDIVILTKNDISWLYDYKKGSIYNDEFKEYKILNKDFYIVTDDNNKQGIMDTKGNSVVNNIYDNIIDYKFGLVTYKNDKNLYGLNYASGEKVISPRYNDIIIIDNTMYAAKTNGKYKIYNVVNNSLKSNNEYNYLWTNNEFIVVIKDKTLDILNSSLESKLVMKINVYSNYDNKNEIERLGIHCDKNYIYFNIYTNNVDYIEYKYSIEDGKILSNK